jgi:hypothetical protein
MPSETRSHPSRQPRRTVLAENPPPPFIPSPYIPSSASSNPPRPASSTVLAGSPSPLFIPPRPITPTPPTDSERSSSWCLPLSPERRDPGFLMPPQMPKPSRRGTYRGRSVRCGFWNRRRDHLPTNKYIVYAPRGRANMSDLENYPGPKEGYMDHHGNVIKYDPTWRELPESLPRQGQTPVLPCDKVITRLITSFL